MSLQTDRIFIKALQSDRVLMSMLAEGDVYNTAISVPDTELDNVPLPYVIVSFDGMNLDTTSKDDSFDGETDTVTVSIEAAAETRPKLADILIRCRKAVAEYFEEYEGGSDRMIPLQTDISASAVQYDSEKPCYWQRLIYQCETNAD